LDLSLFYAELSRPTSPHFGEGIDCDVNIPKPTFHLSFPFEAVALTPGLSCGPQETNSGTAKKPTLWAVSSEPLLGEIVAWRPLKNKSVPFSVYGGIQAEVGEKFALSPTKTH